LIGQDGPSVDSSISRNIKRKGRFFALYQKKEKDVLKVKTPEICSKYLAKTKLSRSDQFPIFLCKNHSKIMVKNAFASNPKKINDPLPGRLALSFRVVRLNMTFIFK